MRPAPPRRVRQEGHRLPPDLRAPRGRRGRRHALGRRARRRGSDRDHPRRRLLPVVHLPAPAQRHRDGPLRQARRPRRHALPGDLRRHPQPVGDVAAALPEQVRAVHRRAAQPRLGGRREVLRARPPRARARARGRVGRHAERRSAARGDRAAQREPQAPARALRSPGSRAAPRADRGGVRRRARRLPAAGRGAQRDRARVPRGGEGLGARAARPVARGARRIVLRAAAARPAQDARARRLLHRRRRPRPRRALPPRRRRRDGRPVGGARAGVHRAREPHVVALRRRRAEGRVSHRPLQEAQGGGRRLLRAELLRPGAARAAHAADGARGRQRAAHELPLLGEHGAVSGHHEQAGTFSDSIRLWSEDQ